ncbi:MAG TPA: ClpXP protease specificity-enhancing factor SspB [Stellaceae bacterium]|nr:ClpXP protease specificity-enhancing factor SspB [Stellaceae bacterium]
MKDFLRYDRMVEAALRGVVREALARTAAEGLPGAHHFYITFRTAHEGVTLPDALTAKHPEDMTVVIEHQYWDLVVEEDHFAVTLTFGGKPERITIPFEAILSFADPAVKFGLQFQQVSPANEGQKGISVLGDSIASDHAPEEPAEKKAAKPGDKSAEVVTLDTFRKK